MLALLPLLACGGWMVVSNEQSNDVAIIDERSGEVSARIAVGKRPRGLRVSPTGQLFVAVSGSVKDSHTPDRSADGIAVIDLNSRKLVRTLSSGPDPETFDFSADGRELYVANEDAATLSFVNVRSGAVVASVSVGAEPEGVTTEPGGKRVWVTSEADHAVFVVDVADRKVLARIATGARPRNVVFGNDGKKAWVMNESGGSITVVDAVTFEVRGNLALKDGARPMAGVLSSDGKELYVTTGRGGTIAVIDTAGDSLLRTIESVGVRPWGIALGKDGRLFTANGPGGDVAMIDARSGKIAAHIATGSSPWGIARYDGPEKLARP
jgi:YVTN family beta-propeller protein